MISKKKLNLILIFGIIGSIFFYSYFLSQNKGYIEKDDKSLTTNQNSPNVEIGTTRFSNVEYKSTDNKGKVYITKGKEAYVSSKKPDTIFLTGVHSYTDLNDGTKLHVRSDKANYFKNSKNIKYYKNVIITNKDVLITAESADFSSVKNIIRLEKNVTLKDSKNIIKSDFAELNTITNDLKIFMKKKQDRVYGQRKK